LRERARHIPFELLCFPIVAGVYAVHLFVSGYDQFYYDAARYWEAAKLFDTGGRFSLLAFDYPRGYFLPLLNHGLQDVASAASVGSVTIMKIFGALLAATLGVVVLPRLARELFPAATIDAGRVLALNGLIFLFWRDHFDFPLSDFPALLVAAVALIGLLRGTTVGYVVAGLGFGLAANMRPEYLPALALAIAAAAALPLKSWHWRTRAVATALVVGGALAASLPQILINHRHEGTWSPVVPGGRDIAMAQLTDGLRAQKYETYVGDLAGYPQPEVFYLDPSTAHVLDKEHVSEITSYSQYAHIVVHHPFELLANWGRHLFNGLDVRYPTPYIRDLGDTSIVLSVFQYTLLFWALARLLLPESRRLLGPIRWVGVAVLLSPCLTAIPGAVEPRFFLPAQVLVYIVLCFGPKTRAALLGGQTSQRVALAVSFVAFVLVCLTLSSATLAQLEHPGPTLGTPSLGP
jgi:hypothetical protein